MMAASVNMPITESMVMAFRVSELQALLAFAGKNKSGRKNELQARALEMVKGKSPPIVTKIKDLYRSIQMSNLGQPYSGMNSSGFGGYGGATTASGLARSGYSDGKYGQDNSFGKSIGYQRVTSMDGQCRTVPICPDIKLKELPFYDIQGILIRPTSLFNQAQSPKQETQHSFCLTPSQAAEIAASREVVVTEGSTGVPITKVQYTVQVQLRFCAIDQAEEQDDLFPPNLVVKVNGRLVQLPQPIPSNRPGVEPKRPSKPLNITNSVKCCPHSNNTVHVQWVTDNTRNYCMTVFMVKRLTAEELFQRLKNKRIQPADFTRGRIKEITSSEEDDLCAPTSISVSVACPLGKNRMTYPCRATTCKHLQCFDANLFLLMNEKKPTFICPVCNKHLKFDDLSIDGYFMDVIRNLSFDAGNEIELFPDGHWEPVVKVKTEPNDYAPPAKKMKTDTSTSLNTTIDLDDDICIVEEDVKPQISLSTVAAQDISKSSLEPEIVDLIDSSDDEEEPPAPASNSRTIEEQEPTLECVVENDNPVDEEKTHSDDEDVGVRPRRRKPRVNYIEESSSDSSTIGNDGGSKSTRRKQHTLSPACIELSDSSGGSSPEPTTERRAFASVSSHSSSRSSSTSSHKNNRSGSGTSTLYSSTATTPPVRNPTGTGHYKVSNSPSPSDRGNLVQADSANNLNHSTNFHTMHQPHQQPSSFAPVARTPSTDVFNVNVPVHSSTPSASSHFYPSASQTQIPPLAGYPSFDPRTTWQSDLNALINPHTQLGHGQMDLTNPFDFNYFNNPNYHLGYDPRNGGGSGGFGNWM